MPTIVQVTTTQSSSAHHSPCFLISSGKGDLHCISSSSSGVVSSSTTTNTFITKTTSAALYPLRAQTTPLQADVRAFQLLSAMQMTSGEFVALLWAVQQRGGGKPAVCEAYSYTFSLAATSPILENEEEGGGGGGSVQFLHRSSMPPHGALCNPAATCDIGGSFVVALDPLVEKVEEEELEEVRGGAFGSTAAVENQPPNATMYSAQRERALNVEEEEENDDVSPRTLQAALSRFSHLTAADDLFTEQEELEDRFQYADIFKESGPDGAGALGAEPNCTLLFFTRDSTTSSTPTKFHCVASVLCHRHRHLGSQLTDNKLRLSLTDDVDCAVIDIYAAASTAAPETTPIDQKESISNINTQNNISFYPGFCVEHVSSIPALAYIAAGKIQRKYLLTAGAPSVGSATAGVLIEARKFLYGYHRIDQQGNQKYGQQAVVDMELEEGEGVLGAALVDGGSDKTQYLLVLCARKLLCYSL